MCATRAGTTVKERPKTLTCVVDAFDPSRCFFLGPNPNHRRLLLLESEVSDHPARESKDASL